MLLTICISFLYKFLIGLTQTSGPCSAGFFCTMGASNSTPTDGTTGDICPAGSYCEAGSITGSACPIGTFSSLTGLINESQCEQCTPGSYCSQAGLTAVSNPCAEGSFLINQCNQLSLYFNIIQINPILIRSID